MPVRRLCFEGPIEELNRTEIIQPCVMTVCWAAYEVWRESYGFENVSVTAGHSLGEIASLAAAGSIPWETALLLVKERGRIMAQAAHEQRGRHDRDRRPGRGPGRGDPRAGLGARQALGRQPQRRRAVRAFGRAAGGPGGGAAGARGRRAPRAHPHHPAARAHAADGGGRGRVPQGRRPPAVQGAVVPDPRQRHGRGDAHCGRPAGRAAAADAAPGRLGADHGLDARRWRCKTVVELGPGRVLASLAAKHIPGVDTWNADELFVDFADTATA